MVPDGAILTYQGTWPCCAGLFVGYDESFNHVSAKLTGSGLVVRNYSITPRNFILNGPYDVTMQVQVENGLGFGDVRDIISIIRHWVYDVEGDFPLADSIVFQQNPGGSPRPTGQPGGGQTGGGGGAGGQKQGCIAGSSQNLSGVFDFGCWWTNLTTVGTSTVVAVGLLALAGLVLIMYSPSARRAVTRR